MQIYFNHPVTLWDDFAYKPLNKKTMFTLTLIRLNSITKVFENTEVNCFMLRGDLEKELSNHHASFEQVEKVLEMEKGQSITIEVDNNDKLWFYYISRIA